MDRWTTAFLNSHKGAVQDQLITWGVNPELPALKDGTVRGLIHKYASASCCFIAGTVDVPGRSYARAVPEALLLAIALGARGVENPAMVLTRQAIELTLKFAFFCDHPVERAIVLGNDGNREYGFQSLIEYLRRHPNLAGKAWLGELCETIEEIFAETSRYVHVHSHKFYGFESFTASDEATSKLLRKMDSLFTRLLPCLVITCFAVRPSKYRSLSLSERRIVRGLLGANGRTRLDDILQ